MTRITNDCHVHSNYSEHPSVDKTSPWLNMEKAVELGLERLYFSEHVDMDYPYQEETNVEYDPCVNMQAYYENLKKMEEAYRGKVRPMFGVELGLMEGNLDKIREYIKGYELDQVLASIHTLHGVGPNFHKAPAWEGWTKSTVQQLYLETMIRLSKEYGDFDCVTHITYYSRNCPFEEKEFYYNEAPDHYDALFKMLIESGKGMEINTSAYRKFGFFLPGLEILKRYREMGGEILTIGSDGHGKDKIGLDLDLAGEMAKEAGFTYYTIFESRKPRFIKL